MNAWRCIAVLLLLTSLLGAAVEDTRFFIREIRVQGATILPPIEIERAVYPFVGPERTAMEIEEARRVLEQRYWDEGYLTVRVEIPPQQVKRGIVVLQVKEIPVGRTRIRGAEYFSLDEIRKRSPSMAEGTVPNFNDITRDVIALNQRPDRRVVPELLPGIEPDSVDIDLKVEDSLPLHGSLELNNRRSPNTTSLRLNGAVRYDNLWQLGHTVGASFQISPQDLDEVQVYSGYYIARFESLDNLALMLMGTKQDTNISTLGNMAVAGRGDIIGLRAMYTLPSGPGDFNSISLGLDRKVSTQQLNTGAGNTTTPIHYYPLDFLYSGIWQGERHMLETYTGIRMHFRGMGSDSAVWDANRFGATGSFFALRGDVAHTHDWYDGIQSYLRVHGQVADSPLISAEQFAGGGLDTVRGYLEGELLGDQALFGTLELRTDSLNNLLKESRVKYSIRLHAFVEGGVLGLNKPLPGQSSTTSLASFGVGARFGFLDYISGSVNFGVPIVDGNETRAWNPRTLFLIRGEF